MADKRDFEVIAAYVAQTIDDDTRRMRAVYVANCLKLTNEKFDWDKYMAACNAE